MIEAVTSDLQSRKLKSNTKKIFLDLFILYILSACMIACHICSWCPQKSEEGIRYPETGIMGHCKPL